MGKKKNRSGGDSNESSDEKRAPSNTSTLAAFLSLGDAAKLGVKASAAPTPQPSSSNQVCVSLCVCMCVYVWVGVVVVAHTRTTVTLVS